MEYRFGASEPILTATSTTQPVSGTTTAVPASTIKGDMNCDGVTDISDAVMLARFLTADAGVMPSDQGVVNADCDAIAGVTADDLTAILRAIAKIITL